MIINGKEDILNPGYYTVSESISNVIRIEFKMDADVDGTALQRAAEYALRRYTYFAVKAVISGNSYLNVENENLFTVSSGIRRIRLLSEESAYYPLAIQYEGERLALDISHALTDGHGLLPFVKTLLYYYICFSTGVSYAAGDISTVETPIFDDELGNPDDKIDYDSITKPLCARPAVENPFTLADIGLKNVGKKTAHYFQIDETMFMRYVKSVGGSPTAVMTAMLAEIMWELSLTDRSLYIGVAIDHRPMLGNLHSYRSLSNLVPVVYERKQRGLSIEKLCSFARETVRLQADRQNVLYFRKQMLEGSKKMEMVPSIEKKRELLKGRIEQSLGRYSCTFSYPGIVDLGEAGAHIKALKALADTVADNCLSAEMLAFGGAFHLSLIQGFDDDIIAKEVMRHLDAEGIHYEYMGSEMLRLSTAVPFNNT